jgi:hypothetical protein
VDVQIRVEAHAGRAFFAAGTRQRSVRESARHKGAIRPEAESAPVDINLRRAPVACAMGAVAQDCTTTALPAGRAASCGDSCNELMKLKNSEPARLWHEA